MHPEEKQRVFWTEKEDERLLALQTEMPAKWEKISQELDKCGISRTGKQVRDRYVNFLDTGMSNEKWSPEEDEVLYHMTVLHGTKWSLVKQGLPGRSEARVKNRYYSYLQHHLPSVLPLSQTPSSDIDSFLNLDHQFLHMDSL